MNNIDIRQYIKNNFKDDNIEDIKSSIEDSISSKEDDPLIGLGVLFEILWNNSTKEQQTIILNNIKKGMQQ
ncbi:MAG: small acid-soluble spore protein SspI [Bacilli bacterium]|nr:small acid-soluble spore protein SspI [Bacilli bacterium]